MAETKLVKIARPAAVLFSPTGVKRIPVNHEWWIADNGTFFNYPSMSPRWIYTREEIDS